MDGGSFEPRGGAAGVGHLEEEASWAPGASRRSQSSSSVTRKNMAATSNKFLYYQSIFSTIHTTHFTGWINQQLASQLNRLLSSLSAATGYQAQKQSVSKDAQACCLVPHIPKKRFAEVIIYSIAQSCPRLISTWRWSNMSTYNIRFKTTVTDNVVCVFIKET